MNVHVCVATGQNFRARLRKRGARKWKFTFVGPRRQTQLRAMQDAIREWDKGGYAEGEITLCADWYDPMALMKFRETKRGI